MFDRRVRISPDPVLGWRYWRRGLNRALRCVAQRPTLRCLKNAPTRSSGSTAPRARHASEPPSACPAVVPPARGAANRWSSRRTRPTRSTPTTPCRVRPPSRSPRPCAISRVVCGSDPLTPFDCHARLRPLPLSVVSGQRVGRPSVRRPSRPLPGVRGGHHRPRLATASAASRRERRGDRGHLLARLPTRPLVGAGPRLGAIVAGGVRGRMPSSGFARRSARRLLV